MSLIGVGRLARENRIQVFLALLLYISFSQFTMDINNWNSVSRLALTANLVQHGRLDIGGYEKLTGDKARFGSTYYSDKAPGMSFLALPVAAIYTAVVPVTSNFRSGGARRFKIFGYLCAMSTSALLTALAAVLLFGYVKELTGSPAAGLTASLTYGLGTPAWIWATTFFGHAAAGALLIIGFILTDRMARMKAECREAGAARIVFAGMALGAAVSVEFTAAVPAAMILGYSGLRRLQRGDFPRSLLAPLATAAVAGLTQIPLLAYDYAIFGSPFHLAYANVPGAMGNGMRTGFFGIFVPKLHIIGEILFGSRRGVFWLSPVLVPAVIALIWWIIRGGDRLRSVTVSLIVLFYILLNAGYLYWDGGWSTGPRHITPVYPFLALALGVIFAQTRRAIRIAVIALLGLSIGIELACVSVDCCASPEFKAPLFDSILPSFFDGDLEQSVFQVAFKTEGMWVLIPLLGAWTLLGFMLWRELRTEPVQATAAG